jgi:hypothetical protein
MKGGEHMGERVALFVAAVGILTLSGFSHFIRKSIANGTLYRNSAIGLRTRATTSSDVAWAAGHKAAGPWLSACAFTGYLMGAATAAGALVTIAADSVHPSVWLLPATGFVGVVALLVRATVIADKHGKNAALVTSADAPDAN